MKKRCAAILMLLALPACHGSAGSHVLTVQAVLSYAESECGGHNGYLGGLPFFVADGSGHPLAHGRLGNTAQELRKPDRHLCGWTGRVQVSDTDVYEITMSSSFGDVHGRISSSELERAHWIAIVKPRPASEPNLGSFPNQDERQLLAWIPTQIAETCERSLGGPVPPYSDAALTCQASGVDVDYERYTSADNLHRAYDQILTGQHIDPGEGSGCPAVPSEQSWHFRGSSTSQGRVTCFTFSSSFVKATFERARIEVTLASEPGASVDPLWNVWQSGLLVGTPRH